MSMGCTKEHEPHNCCADLHTHTTASDGLLSPSELIKKSAAAGLCAVGIADHDTIDGIAEAYEASKQYGIEVVPAVELNTRFGKEEIHILGYYIQTDLVWFKKILSDIRHSRQIRARKMVDNLRRLYGMDITYEEVEIEAKDGVIARPHIARALIKKQLVTDMSEAFAKYIGNNCPAYEPRFRLTTEEGIRVVSEAGGVPVLAHPGLLSDAGLVNYVIRLGVKGIEVYHSKHTPEQCRRYDQLARKYGLLITGGSDYHGYNEAGGVNLGDVKVPYDVVDKLKKFAAESEKNIINKA